MTMASREFAAVLAQVQLTMGQLQCKRLLLVDEMPGPAPRRSWWATVTSTSGNDAMARLKSAIFQVSPELIPYIQYWDYYPPDF